MTLDANTSSRIHASWSWVALHNDRLRMLEQLGHLGTDDLADICAAACDLIGGCLEVAEAKTAEHVHRYNSRGLCVCDFPPVPEGVDGVHIGTRVWP